MLSYQAIFIHVPLLKLPFDIKAERFNELLFEALVLKPRYKHDVLLGAGLHELLRRVRGPHILDILIVLIAFGLRTLNLLVFLSQFCNLLADLRMEVEESKLYVIVRVFGDFELRGDISVQLNRKIQNTDDTGVIHVCKVVWKLERCRVQEASGRLHGHHLNLWLFSAVDYRFLNVKYAVTYLL